MKNTDLESGKKKNQFAASRSRYFDNDCNSNTENFEYGDIRFKRFIDHRDTPERRLSIKTFINKKSDHVVKEAIQREILRGGQVFYLHNQVKTIEKTAIELQKEIPEASVSIAHGQMREQQLEQVMLNFHRKTSNVLVCTTIIETGLDIPNANTIIIERADKLGLAQIHQLRGQGGTFLSSSLCVPC